jgi:hypothetical protein
LRQAIQDSPHPHIPSDSLKYGPCPQVEKRPRSHWPLLRRQERPWWTQHGPCEIVLMLRAENGMSPNAHLEPLGPLGTFVPIPRVDPARRSTPSSRTARAHSLCSAHHSRLFCDHLCRQGCARSPYDCGTEDGAIQAYSLRCEHRAAARRASPPPREALARCASWLMPPPERCQVVHCFSLSC